MAASDHTRVSALRKARLDAGWVEVRQWAASAADAEKLRAYGEQLRMETLEGTLRSIGQKRKMPEAVIDRALLAIWAQGSREYISPSGATLELLSDLARAQALRDVNGVYEMFVHAHPSNARNVSSQVPAKVLNHYVLSQLDFRGTERFMTWQKQNPKWAEHVLAALDDFTLAEWAREAVDGIRNTELK